MDAISFPPAPTNEPNLTYAPGTPERESLLTEIAALESESRDLPAYVGGEWRACGGEEIQVVQPHDHQHVLGVTRNATTADAQAAVDAALLCLEVLGVLALDRAMTTFGGALAGFMAAALGPQLGQILFGLGLIVTGSLMYILYKPLRLID